MRRDDEKKAITQETRSLYSRYEEDPLLAELFAETQKKRLKSKLGDTNTPLTELDFNRCLDLLPQQKNHDDLPNTTFDSVDIQHPGYHIVKLPINDPRAFILGKITHCCQSINGHAQQCVINGWTLPDCGFYVLLKQNNKNKKVNVFNTDGSINYDDYHIVGQTYAWLTIYGNLVFSAWVFLKQETKTLDKATLLKAYATKIVSDSQSHIYRVMIGRNTHIPSPNEFKKNSIEREVLLTDLPYQESVKQTEMACVDDDLWKNNITNAAEKLPLNAEKKKLLYDYAPPCIRYLDLLIACVDNPFLFERLKIALNEKTIQKQMMFLKQLTALYSTFPTAAIQTTFYFLNAIDKSLIKKAAIHFIDSNTVYLTRILILLEKEPLLPDEIIKMIHDALKKLYCEGYTDFLVFEMEQLPFFEMNTVINILKKLQEAGFKINADFYNYAHYNVRYFPSDFFLDQLSKMKCAGIELTSDVLAYSAKTCRSFFESIKLGDIEEGEITGIVVSQLMKRTEKNIALNPISSDDSSDDIIIGVLSDDDSEDVESESETPLVFTHSELERQSPLVFTSSKNNVDGIRLFPLPQKTALVNPPVETVGAMQKTGFIKF